MFLTLIFTGLSLQYSSVDFELINFNSAVTWHNVTGILLSIGFVFYLIGNRFTSNGTYYQFKLKGLLKRVLKQFKYYSLGIFKKEKAPYPISKKRKFNPLQKLSYVLVMYFLMPIVIFSGFGLLYPELLPTKLLGLSGIHVFDLVHITAGFFLSVFMIVHVYFCTIGKTPTANFKSMINGWH
jgi:thiosulfate reductase cytochrome b subunit